MFTPLSTTATAPRQAFAWRTFFLLLVTLGGLLLLACNPFGGDGEESADDSAASSEEVVDVSFDRSSEGNSINNQQPANAQPTKQPTAAATEQAQGSPDEATPGPPASGIPEGSPTPAEQPTGNTSPSVGSDRALDQVWAFLSQCVSLGTSELEANQISGEWFVQAAGEDPDRYGIWKVDPATGSIQPHNIRARQWEPRINPSCTENDFEEFYQTIPSRQSASTVTEAGQAVTSLWATLVKCYPAISPEDLQAILNPARAEWIVAAKPEITTNYGVWRVGSTGEALPHNRQAQAIYGQLDSGLC